MPLFYRTLKETAVAEVTEKKSRFLALAAPVRTEAEALALLEQVRTQYPDARHHVYAYTVTEEGAERTRYSDDGEPQGTGGLPVLEVLKKKSLSNVFVVVTRYFGGILLGAAGLTRAYAGSAAEALDKAGIAKIYTCDHIRIVVPYSEIGKMQTLLFNLQGRFKFRCDAPVYAESAAFPLYVSISDTDAFCAAVTDATRARAAIFREETQETALDC